MMWFLTTILFLISCHKEVTPQSQAPAVQEAAQAKDAYDRYYGIYFNGNKVGFMHSTFKSNNNSAYLDLELHAEVVGMGQNSIIDIKENRTYDLKTKHLQNISFKQQAATGSVEVIGERQNEAMQLKITAGGQTTSQAIAVHETLDDVLATLELAKTKQLEKTIKVKHFDPSLQKEEDVEHRLIHLEEKNFGGVKTDVVEIESKYLTMGISENSFWDGQGKMLESRLGGFFVQRLEPKEVAQKLDYKMDVLISNVVASPKINAQAESLQIEFTGFNQFKLPTSKRQQIKNNIVMLKRDPQPLPTKIGKDVLKEYLESTPFIQSNAPQLQAAAKEIVGNTTDAFEASSKLVHFVYAHIQDEYVPAYSNALEAWQSKRGDCTEHSVLFVALARAIGIPARVAAGIGYWPPGNGFGWHAWAEVYINGSWLSVDPTWNQPIADVTHIKLAEGDPQAQAKIVMLLGQLRIVKVHG